MSEDMGWEVQEPKGRVRYHWRPFNRTYGTWYELMCERSGLSSPIRVPPSDKTAMVMVQPDMEPGRWYWSIRVGATQKTREQPKWGTARSLEDAMHAAREALMSWT